VHCEENFQPNLLLSGDNSSAGVTTTTVVISSSSGSSSKKIIQDSNNVNKNHHQRSVKFFDDEDNMNHNLTSSQPVMSNGVGNDLITESQKLGNSHPHVTISQEMPKEQDRAFRTKIDK
jgi:hypothetical protein